MKHQNLLQSILADIKCPVCQQPFNSSQIKFRGEVQNRMVFSYFCPRHIQPVKIILTISRHQPERRQAVTYNDYLDLKNQLKKE